MQKNYNPKDLEPKIRSFWEENKIYQADLDSKREKFLSMGMFNYPSGSGLHVGHAFSYTVFDVMARFKRQQGYNSYHPVGWDNFGSPAELFAIKTGRHPAENIADTIKMYRKQYQSMGWSNDWSKEIQTSDPNYFKWTQKIFLDLFNAGLAYQKESQQWWCDKCQSVIADAQVESNGKCWRHDSDEFKVLGKKAIRQWFFKITAYADRLLEGIDDLNWTSSVKQAQKNWIGRKSGLKISYEASNTEPGLVVEVFTTRPETNFGATFIAISPEHPLVKQLLNKEIKPFDTSYDLELIKQYVDAAAKKSEMERKTENRLKTGVFSGIKVINSLTKSEMPVWISDFVLNDFGTGALVGVPGHDLRDFEFATEFNLPIIRVIKGLDGDESLITTREQVQESEGTIINSKFLDGLSLSEAAKKIEEFLINSGNAEKEITYSMRDWSISRQRFWGAPIPIIHCEHCGTIPLQESDLPLELPKITNFKPEPGQSTVLISKQEDWVSVTCPKCGKSAKRETDTMDGYVCSSWYFLRYIDPFNTEEQWNTDKANHWMPVDFYGGGDHAVAHLLYARFFMHFFYDQGKVKSKEPFKRMLFHGKVAGADGSKFSKSKGNGVDPLEIIESGYGADALRTYLMFAAPLTDNIRWDKNGVPGAYKYLVRVWQLVQDFIENSTKKEPNEIILKSINKTIHKVTKDIESENYNTAIAALMECLNTLKKQSTHLNREILESYLQLLAPFAPHITDYLWQELGNNDSIHVDHWPKVEDKYLRDDQVAIGVQVNGKVRGVINIAAQASQAEAVAAAKQVESINQHLVGMKITKIIFVPGRILNFVIK